MLAGVPMMSDDGDHVRGRSSIFKVPLALHAAAPWDSNARAPVGNAPAEIINASSLVLSAKPLIISLTYSRQRLA